MKWAKRNAYEFGFVIVILRSNTTNGQRGRKMYVLLGCERGGKYRRYKYKLLKVVLGYVIVLLDCEENPSKMVKDGLYNYFVPLIIMTWQIYWSGIHILVS